MKTQPITHTEARRLMRLRFGGFSIPRGSQCYLLTGVQFAPTRGNCYLWAGEDDSGMVGIYIVRAKREALKVSEAA